MKNLIITALNRYLAQDVEKAKSLEQINGKAICIVLRDTGLNLGLRVRGSSVEEFNDSNVKPDVEIIVSPSTLPQFMLGTEQDQLIKSGDIEIRGDSHIASVLQNTLRNIEVDWEEIVSGYLGDAAAYRLGTGARALHAFGHRLRQNIRLDMRDYLQDNLQVSATQDEVDQFIKEVDQVRAQTDRLEARLDQLLTRDH